MHKIGLAQGGSLDNAIVIDENGIVNSEGLRYKDEFVKHKALDFIGDIFLSSYYILGEFTAYKTGHNINNKFLHHLFDQKNCWQLI
jgi:UDP-3-O-[3-hydroxymyristoyl] N-acetylglucosamine deacetylase